jgi:hypothetical protein
MFLDQHLQIIKIIIGGAPIWTPFTAITITLLERSLYQRSISSLFFENLIIYCVILHCLINFLAGVIESSLVNMGYFNILNGISPMHFGHLSMFFIGFTAIKSKIKLNKILCACSIFAFYIGIGFQQLQPSVNNKVHTVLLSIYFIIPSMILLLSVFSKCAVPSQHSSK